MLGHIFSPDGIAIDPDTVKAIIDKKGTFLQEAHCGIASGHYAGEMTRKIWNSGLWWPTTSRDRVD